MLRAYRWWLAVGVVAWGAAHGAMSLQAGIIDPESEKVLREMTVYTQDIKSFRTELTASYKLEAAGKPVKVNFTYSLIGEKPNRLASIVRSGGEGPVMISDGKQLYTLVPQLGKYVLGDTPASFADIIKSDSAKGTGLGHAIFAGTMLSLMSYDEIASAIDEAKYVGEEKVGLAKCQHLKLIFKDYDWDVWIDIGKRPMVRKLEPALTKWLTANPGPVPADTKVELSMTFKTWATDVALKDKDFKIEPAASAKQVTSFTAPAGSANGPASLKGQPAPGFSLAMLGGGTMNLAAHQDKDIVLLDFWATWCGYCIRAMPDVAELASAYRSRGVVFYAVNKKEDAATIQQFLQEKQWSIPVALDPDGAVAGQFKVGGIPHFVIVGRDGTVQAVHVGAGTNIKQELAAELDAVLAASPPPKPATTKKK